MKYANHVSEVVNAFSPEPLQIDQMDRFYCDETMEYRMSDKYSSPMEDIFDICKEKSNYNAFLLLGHRGCGKSTELNKLSAKFLSQGYQVKTITCSIDLDLLNIVHSDLFILMGEALLEIVKECNCNIKKSLLDSIINFWSEGVETVTFAQSDSALLDSGIGAETGGILKNILNIFANIKMDLKYNEETRTEYRQKIRVRSC